MAREREAERVGALGQGVWLADAGLPVSRYMKPEVHYLREEMWIDAAAAYLRERGLSDVTVVDDEGRPVGVVSTTELISFSDGIDVAGLDDGGDPASAQEVIEPRLGPGFHLDRRSRGRVRDVMIPYVPVIAADASIASAAAAMLENHLDPLVVVASDGTVVGCMSSRDLALWVVEQTHVGGERDLEPPSLALSDAGLRLRDIMRPAVAVRREDSLLGVRGILWANDLHEVPVVDGTRVVGVVTEVDIDELIAAHCEDDGWAQDLVVDDVMKAPPILGGPDDPIGSVRAILEADDCACILVEQSGRLLGIVTHRDAVVLPARPHRSS